MQIDAQIRAASAGIEVERANTLPTVGFGVDAGIQGEDYGFGYGQN